MKKISQAFLMMSLVFTACNSHDKTAEGRVKDKYEQTKETLAQTEKKNPMRFLSVAGNDRKNLIGQTVIKPY